MAEGLEGELKQRLEEILRTQGGHELLYHSILTAMSTQIPLPLMDIAARRAIRSSMFSRICRLYNRPISASDAMTLAADPGEEGSCCIKSCLMGCGLQLLLFPIRRIIRTIRAIRNYQELVDLATTTFVEGYVVLYLLLIDEWPNLPARELRGGIDAVLQEAGTKPVQAVFRVGFEETRGQMVRAARSLYKKLAGSKPEQETITRKLDEVKPEEEDLLAPVLDRVGAAMEQPRGYFEELHKIIRRRFVAADGPGSEEAGTGLPSSPSGGAESALPDVAAGGDESEPMGAGSGPGEAEAEPGGDESESIGAGSGPGEAEAEPGGDESGSIGAGSGPGEAEAGPGGGSESSGSEPSETKPASRESTREPSESKPEPGMKSKSGGSRSKPASGTKSRQQESASPTRPRAEPKPKPEQKRKKRGESPPETPPTGDPPPPS
ncbi:MAG: hypothetical protein HY319_07925 [Armatimonadetes bacterium]|nr:hypothetical protein [Armatimonadota bacterium]